MSWFGGAPEGGGGSKMRSPASFGSEELPDHSSGFGGGSPSGGGADVDLQQAVAMEQQKLQFMTQVHKLNETCWETCIGSVSSSLSSREENCLKNCADRFVDTTMLITNRFAQLAQKMQQR